MTFKLWKNVTVGNKVLTSIWREKILSVSEEWINVKSWFISFWSIIYWRKFK